MTLKDEPYDLPDAALLADSNGPAYQCLAWVPERTVVVLGLGDDATTIVNQAALAADNVSLQRRPSGGEAVVLTSAMTVISLLRRGEDQPPTRVVFRHACRVIAAVIAELGGPQAEQAGISDLTIAGRKIAGSAIYRGRERLFYHAVINVAEAGSRIARYLAAPRRPPTYRQGRGHDAFVTSLVTAGCQTTPAALAAALQYAFAHDPF
jgi:lipoate---protein ligase